ncbi:hypothetical protein EJB05_38879, partial [Eragrostis curvula]
MCVATLLMDGNSHSDNVPSQDFHQANAGTNDEDINAKAPDGNEDAYLDNGATKNTDKCWTTSDDEHSQGHILVDITSRGWVSTQPNPAASDSERASGGRSPGDTRGLVSSVAVDSLGNSLIDTLVINAHESNDKPDDCPSANRATLTDSTNGTARVVANELPVSLSLGSIAQRKRKLSFEGSPTCVQQGPDGNLTNVMSPTSCNPFDAEPIDLGPDIHFAMRLDSDSPAAATPSIQAFCLLPDRYIP